MGACLMFKAGDPLPKIASTNGALVSEWKTCGKPTCRCARGQPHGPYLSLRWREGGRQRRRYVSATEANAVRASIADRRLLTPPTYSVRQELAALRRLTRALIDVEAP